MQQLDVWVCTDPDNKQYGRWLGDGRYQFKETDFDGESVELEIDLSQYSEEEMGDNVGAYYNSVEELKSIYGEDSAWIIAECIFENESGLYLS